MKRVVILGRGAAGKSTLALRLGKITGLPVIELDKIFWRPGLIATPRDEWVEAQQVLAGQERWIMDGDLGPYDALEAGVRAADTIILLDFSLPRCAWRALRRSREGVDFWRWVFAYRRQYRPVLMETIARHAAGADLHTLRTPNAVRQLLAQVAE